MVWGAPRGVDDIVSRLSADDPSLMALYLMRTRRFKESDAATFCEALKSNKTLKDLNISSHAITPSMAASFASALAANSSLLSLSLGNSTFGDESLKALCPGIASSSSLHMLDLDTKGITSASCEYLAEAIKHSSSLHTLIISRNLISPDGITVLAPHLGNLQHLDLSGCGITCPKATRAISDVLSTSQKLKHLDLGDNLLEDIPAVEALCSGFDKAVDLQELHIGGCSLGSQGITKLSLHLPSTLSVLDISDSGAGVEGFIAFAEALSTRLLNLEKLVACNCQADDEAIAALAKGLSSRNSYNDIEIDLGGNAVGPAALENFARCTTLRSLCLHDCKLGTVGAQALQRILTTENNNTGDGGDATVVFKSLDEFDLSANGLEETDIVGILNALSINNQEGAVACPALTLLVIAANPGSSEDGTTAAVEALQAARPNINVVRRSADTGEQAGVGNGNGN